MEERFCTIPYYPLGAPCSRDMWSGEWFFAGTVFQKVLRQREGDPEPVVVKVPNPNGIAVGPDVFVVATTTDIVVFSKSTNEIMTKFPMPSCSVTIFPDQRHYIVGGCDGVILIDDLIDIIIAHIT